MSHPPRHDTSCCAALAILGALAACSRGSEPAAPQASPTPSTQAAEPHAPALVADAPRPSPRYVVSGARVIGTERTPQTDAALNAVRRHVHGLMPCYVRMLDEQPTLGGSIALELTVDPAGKLTQIELKPSKDELELVSGCAYDLLSNAVVALPSDTLATPVRMHYDLAFSPPPRDPPKTTAAVTESSTPAPKTN